MKTIFLSHSTKDDALADALYTLLNSFIDDKFLNYEVFYSPESLTDFEKHSAQWKDEIVKAVKSCDIFIVLWTPNSIENRWVNYEIGIAKAMNKTIYAIGVNGINFNLIIPNETQTLFLKDTANIKKILSNLFKIDKSDVSHWATRSGKEIIIRINKIVKQQCVFFAGSIQNEEARELEIFVTKLSDSLLKSGYKLASYPTVEHIGAVVAQRAINFDSSRYEIAGLYQFDKDIEIRTTQLGCDIEKWNSTIDSFRRIYLEGMNYMIIIGGGKYTASEYRVAKRMPKLQIFPIPCFGGIGKEVYDNMSNNEWFSEFKHPCVFCEKKERINGECPHIEKFIKRFEELIIIPNE